MKNIGLKEYINNLFENGEWVKLEKEIILILENEINLNK